MRRFSLQWHNFQWFYFCRLPSWFNYYNSYSTIFHLLVTFGSKKNSLFIFSRVFKDLLRFILVQRVEGSFLFGCSVDGRLEEKLLKYQLFILNPSTSRHRLWDNYLAWKTNDFGLNSLEALVWCSKIFFQKTYRSR